MIYVAFNSSMSGIDFFFFKKTDLILSVFSVCSLKESADFGTSRKSFNMEKQPESSEWILLHFPVLSGTDGKSHAFPM